MFNTKQHKNSHLYNNNSATAQKKSFTTSKTIYDTPNHVIIQNAVYIFDVRKGVTFIHFIPFLVCIYLAKLNSNA